MNKQITFLAFSKNDIGGERKRVNLFIESICSQDTDQWKMIFWDASSLDKQFNIPSHKNIKIICSSIVKSYNWCPSTIRNTLALMVDTEILCHINADCIYASNFASTLIENCKSKTLILCKRIDQDKKQIINTLQDGFDILEKAKEPKSSPMGECQCMMTQDFINMGGYYGLIKNGKSTYPIDIQQSIQEDTWLYRYAQGYIYWPYDKDRKDKKNFDIIQIFGKTKILHLWHSIRYDKLEYQPKIQKK